MEEILVEIGGCVDDSSKPLHSSISNRRERAPGSGGGGDSEPFLLTELMKEDVYSGDFE